MGAESNPYAKHTSGPWQVDDHADAVGTLRIVAPEEGHIVAEAADPHDADLIAAVPDLLSEARVLRCLATSPRFQRMTVAEALAELKANGCGHDDGAALAKAEGSR